jgi:hypothetical protein
MTAMLIGTALVVVMCIPATFKLGLFKTKHIS